MVSLRSWGEIAIYTHGWNKDENDATEEFNRVRASLNHNNYIIPLIGLSWNSKVDYPMAQNNAKDNGPKLAQFIIDFNNRCLDTHIRLLSHSLGAAVIESSLVSLDATPTLNASSSNNSKIIKSVHLLGATINNKLIVKNTALGNATERLVDKFYNLYNPQDDGLEYNREIKKHDPLGLFGAPKRMAVPLNYVDINVAYEIPPFSDADGDGNVEECFEDIKPILVWGDNHCGYIGFRQPLSGSLIDDGAMNIVVRDWIKS
jgi:esterase/lipase superfamily enzyme